MKLTEENGTQKVLDVEQEKLYLESYDNDDEFIDREEVGFDELGEWLPLISKQMGCNLAIKVEASPLNETYGGSDGSILRYRIFFDDECVFDENTEWDACVVCLRERVVAYIARLVEDFSLFSQVLAKE